MTGKISKRNYRDYVEQKAPKSKLFRNMAFAFLFGGLICCIGQGINDFARYVMNFNIEHSAIFQAVVLIFLGAFFTGVGFYSDLGKVAGAGSIVPITGFANSIVSPAMEFKKEGLILGVGAKLFTIAGPVLVNGITASIIYGVIYYILRIL